MTNIENTINQESSQSENIIPVAENNEGFGNIVQEDKKEKLDRYYSHLQKFNESIRKMKLPKDGRKIMVLVDLSYMVFYRFFSTQIKFLKKYPDFDWDEDYNWTENEEFISDYEKNFLSSLNRLSYKFRIPDENIVFVRDCPRETIWRLEHYKEYKGTRKNTCKFRNKNLSVGFVFRYTYQKIMPSIMEERKYHLVKVDTAEADDVIGVLVRKIQNEYYYRSIIIVANDNDYLQLASNSVYIWSLTNKLLNDKIKISPKIELLNKIVHGDISDNIPPCIETIESYKDREVLQSIIEYPELLKEYLETDDDFKNQFELNRSLVDFNFIPKNIKEMILDETKNILPDFRRKDYFQKQIEQIEQVEQIDQIDQIDQVEQSNNEIKDI